MHMHWMKICTKFYFDQLPFRGKETGPPIKFSVHTHS